MTHDFSYSDGLQKVTVTIDGESVELVGCSYKGVSFFFEEVSKSNAGRQIVSKPIPFSTDHINEDVGLSVPEYPVTFYLVGADCDSQREALEKVFCEEGAGELVHPYYGKFQTRCKGYNISYKKDATEYVSGSVTFVPESDTNGNNRTQEDIKAVTKDKAQNSLDSAKNKFSTTFSIASKAKTIVDAVSDFTDDLINDINEARASMRSVSEFMMEVSKIRANVSIILQTPGDFASRLQNLLTMTLETLGIDDGDPVDYVNESLTMMDNGLGSSSRTSSPVADDLLASIQSLVLVSAAATVVKNLVNCKFDSASEASEYQDKVHAAFEAAIENATDVSDYQNLQDLEASALKYLRDSMSSLPVVIAYPLPATTNVLAVCFDCYGDLDKLDDVIARNRLSNPGIITRRSLKVLSK